MVDFEFSGQSIKFIDIDLNEVQSLSGVSVSHFGPHRESIVALITRSRCEDGHCVLHLREILALFLFPLLITTNQLIEMIMRGHFCDHRFASPVNRVLRNDPDYQNVDHVVCAQSWTDQEEQEEYRKFAVLEGLDQEVLPSA